MKIFVSYSRRDAGDFARQIHEYLKDEHDVFTDVNNIQMGSVWSNVIGNNISNCDLFVIILTHASLRSPHVESEVLQAQKENKVIVPCFHSSVRNDEIKWNLSVLQGLVFNNEYDLVRNLGLFSRESSGKKDDSKLKDISKLKDDSTDKGVTKSKQGIGSGSKDDSTDKGVTKSKQGIGGVRSIGQSMLSTKPRRISLKILIPIIGVIIIVSIAALTFSGVFIKNIQNTTNTTSMTTTNGSAVEFNSRGDELSDKGKYQEAITYYDKALAVDPKYAGSLDGKAKALISLGQYNKALTYLSKALEIEPHYEAALADKGIALVNIGHHSEALKSIDAALAINPNDTYALNAKGNAFDGLGNYKEAITYYDKALAIDPNFVYALSNKGSDLYNLGKPEEAITYYDKAISADPNYADSWTNKALALFSLGNYKEAITNYDKALQLNPNDRYALNGKQNALSKIGSPPISNNQSVVTSINTPKEITLGVSDQDQTDNLTANITSGPSHGKLSDINQDTGIVTYTPDQGFTGNDKFEFKANDGKLDSKNAGEIKIIVDHPPISNNQSVVTSINTPKEITLGVSDQDQTDNLTANITSGPSHGKLSDINQDTGIVTYTPDQGFTGNDKFEFKANDGKLESKNAGIISITVKGT